MNIKVCMLIFLISVSGFLNGQELNKTGNISSCIDSLINKQNSICPGNTEQLLVSVNNLAPYKPQSKNIPYQNNIKSSSAPLEPINHVRYGLKLTQHFNYPLLHSSPTPSIYYKNHNIYVGPEYTIILTKSSDDSTDNWKPGPWGINVGYRYILKSEHKKTNLFVQMNFSFYQVKYKEYEPGSTVATDKEKMIIENTGGLGVNYRFNKKLEMFGGLGIGTTKGFFLLLKSVIPHSFLGIGYTIN